MKKYIFLSIGLSVLVSCSSNKIISKSENKNKIVKKEKFKKKEFINKKLIKNDEDFIKNKTIDKANNKYIDMNVPMDINNFHYKVQILALKKEILSDNLKKFLSFIVKETYFNEDTGLTSYLIGRFPKYEEALFFKNYIKSNGIDDAFIVGFHNDKRIKDINYVIELEKNFYKTDIFVEK